MARIKKISLATDTLALTISASCAVLTLFGCGDLNSPEGAMRVFNQRFTSSYDDYMAQANEAIAKGDANRVIANYHKALAAAQSQYGPNDLRIATSSSFLAAFEASLGRLQEAEQDYRKALELDKEQLGYDNAETLRIRKELAQVLVRLGKQKEARALLRSSKDNATQKDN